MLPKNATYYFTKASVKRALSEKELQSLAMQSGLHGDTYPDVETAVTAAKEKAKQHQRGRDHAHHLLFTFMTGREVPMSCGGGDGVLK